MARALSSQKRHRQNKTRAARNQGRKTQLKSQMRRVRDALVSKDVTKVEAEFAAATALLDRNASRHTIHRNTAARRKSRLAKRINALKASAKK